jgi:beta-lactam-binding protein with PASTA domain
MRPRRRRLISGLLAAGLLALLVAGVGVGHRVSEALVVDRHMFFVAGNELARADGDTGRLDGRQEIPPGGGTTEVAQPPRDGTGPGYLAEGHTVSPYDPRTMKVGPPQTFSQGVQALPGTRLTYLLEPARGQVTTFPGSGGPSPDRSPGPAASQEPPGPSAHVGAWRDHPVVDGADVLWLLTEGGTKLSHVAGGTVRSIPVPGGFAASLLTLVGDRPVVLAGGRLLRLRDDDATWDTHPVDRRGGADATLAAPSESGSVAWLVERAGDQSSLIGVDLATGKRRGGPVDGAPAGGVGRPVVAGTAVYLPVGDEDNGYAVHRYDGATGRSDGRTPVDVPWDPRRPLELTVRHGQVWAHVRGGTMAVLFDPDQPDRERSVPLDPDAPPGPTRGSTPGPTPTPTSAPTATAPRAPRPLPTASASPPDTEAVPAGPGVPPAPPDTSPAPPAQLPLARVPNVIGQDRLAGCAMLQGAGFTCAWLPTAGRGTPGSIAGTDPRPDAPVAKGTVVTISYLTVGMPDLRGQPYGTACKALRGQAQCRVEPALTPAPAYSAGGLVASQTVPVGVDIPPGTSVVLTYYDKVPVPNLVGQDGTASCTTVASVLSCALTTGGPGSAATPPGTVTSQDPVAGGVVALNTQLSLIVAGQRPIVPNVTGPQVNPYAACAAVQQANLACVPQPSPYVTPNVVFQQNPPAGTPTDPGAAVTVNYWPVNPQPILRYRQSDGDRVWVLRGNGVPPPLDRYEAKGQTGSSALGNGDPAIAAFLNPFTDFECPTCAYDINHYMTTGGAPPSGPGWISLGVKGWVFKAQYRPEMVPLHRMFHQDSKGRSWAYAIYNDGAWQAYAGRGYRDDGVLGYVWPD